MDFANRYGPWALVAGASEGVGECFARTLAERGLNVLLLSRRQTLLDALAARIQADTGVETKTAAVDLSQADAAEQVQRMAASLDIGMLVYCAGADPNYQPFLDSPLDTALSLVHRNCAVPLALCHHFATPMVQRGKGGIILLSSGAGLAGGRNMVAYGASKAFDLVMGEALWAELQESGLDVLSLVLAGTDTPALRRTLVKLGSLEHEDDPVPGLTQPQQVVDEALENLQNGPTWFAGESSRAADKALRAMTRNEAVKAIMQHQASSFMAGSQE